MTLQESFGGFTHFHAMARETFDRFVNPVTPIWKGATK
jgi:hypothetical protein